MRKKIFEIIEPSQGNNVLSSIYDYFIIIMISLSILPLCFKNTNNSLIIIDTICLIVFIIDYLLRWITADYKYNKRALISFIRYPLGVFAIIDIISILPSISILNNGFKLLRIFLWRKTEDRPEPGGQHSRIQGPAAQPADPPDEP